MKTSCKSLLNVSEIYECIQGEGRYAGHPMLLVRLSGCTRKCSFCDSKYHIGITRRYTYDDLACTISWQWRPRYKAVLISGGEPLLQRDLLFKTIKEVQIDHHREFMNFHLETNGDLIKTLDDLLTVLRLFEYISISPKELKVAKRIYALIGEVSKNIQPDVDLKTHVDIKVVTDLKTIGKSMLPFATVVMPYTSMDEKKDKQIRKDVLQWCTTERVRYSPRIHYEVFGSKRGV